MRLRTYNRRDVRAMCRLDAACFDEPFRFDQATMQKFAEADGAIVEIAENQEIVEDDAQDEIAAFLILHLEEMAEGLSGYLVTIDVAGQLRRTGLGSMMLQRAEEEAKAAGAVQIRLHVEVNNAGAIRFYENMQYECIDRARHFYRQAGSDALVYAKAL